MTERLLRYRENIAAACPELAMETAELFRAGQNNDLILVNGELIFRFPKYRQGIAGLRREQAVLDAVRPRLPLATPEYIYHNVDEEEVGRAFVGYRKLPGSSLWSEEFAQISDEGTIDRLATDVASFLQTLHATPLDSIRLPLARPAGSAGGMASTYDVDEHSGGRLSPSTAEARCWSYRIITFERCAGFSSLHRRSGRSVKESLRRSGPRDEPTAARQLTVDIDRVWRRMEWHLFCAFAESFLQQTPLDEVVCLLGLLHGTIEPVFQMSQAGPPDWHGNV